MVSDAESDVVEKLFDISCVGDATLFAGPSHLTDGVSTSEGRIQDIQHGIHDTYEALDQNVCEHATPGDVGALRAVTILTAIRVSPFRIRLPISSLAFDLEGAT
ncbi:hypothetical protein [Halobellus ruber]|uniref:Uncharacterized protein n=1 Tax=Halobellus ruber TaxID=2761102 RepID=A0A7J9SI98_9EURY|nr:hypothetical protein [Halobellus ruber]MBB6645736.1 hypothetical protein [Halobellus ruber]